MLVINYGLRAEPKVFKLCLLSACYIVTDWKSFTFVVVKVFVQFGKGLFLISLEQDPVLLNGILWGKVYRDNIVPRVPVNKLRLDMGYGRCQRWENSVYFYTPRANVSACLQQIVPQPIKRRMESAK